MKIIAYCNECMQDFVGAPSWRFTYFKWFIEEFIDYNQFYPLVYQDDYIFNEYIRFLEERGFILTSEKGPDILFVRPNCINYIEVENRPDLEIYQICLDITAHHNYSLDEILNDDQALS